ncbi:universal stress protein [Paraburkholderia mimosarum]|uniref:universal stress protein n=1 Tax=Paraburkholderia mimosarum TaxID=312026 RepID=UPI001378AFB9
MLTLTGSEQLEVAREELRRAADSAIKAAQSALDGCGAQLEQQVLDLCRLGGDLVHALAEAVSQWAPDLVVLGARRHGALLRWVGGEVSAPLARLLSSPILIVPVEYGSAVDGPPSRILLAATLR